MTSRLDRTFARLRQRGEKALIAYVMAGDPSLQDTEQLVVELEQAGADIINWVSRFLIPSPMVP